MIWIIALGIAGVIFLAICLIVGILFMLNTSPNGGRAKYYKPIAKRGRMPCTASGGAYPTHIPSRWEHTQVETFAIDTIEAKVEQARRLWLQTESDRQPALHGEKSVQRVLPEPPSPTKKGWKVRKSANARKL